MWTDRGLSGDPSLERGGGLGPAEDLDVREAVCWGAGLWAALRSCVSCLLLQISEKYGLPVEKIAKLYKKSKKG